ncbi:hypothetical protein VQL36_13275 [Chengkuizengella sp. SCS-71B]
MIEKNEEEDLMSLFGSVTGENFQNDTVLFETLTEEIPPKYTSYIQKLTI